jgi:RimJ/RimL family protein N-acetyltransferase
MACRASIRRRQATPARGLEQAVLARRPDMTSKRLRYERLMPPALDEFHRLVTDEHVRRYLMDGQIFPRDWSLARIEESAALFESRGVGLWLARVRQGGDLAGFCGFLEFPSLHPEPQLVYALLERFTGCGYATEMAQAAIAEARRHAGFARVIAGVDEPNVASIRVLEKLGFRPFDVQPGSFGRTILMGQEGNDSA